MAAIAYKRADPRAYPFVRSISALRRGPSDTSVGIVVSAYLDACVHIQELLRPSTSSLKTFSKWWPATWKAVMFHVIRIFYVANRRVAKGLLHS